MRVLKRVLGWSLLLAFLALTTAGIWLPPVIGHAVEKDYRFPEVAIDATVRPNGDLVLEERRTFEFRNGPFTYAYFNVDDPLDRVRDFSIAEVLADGSEVPVEPDSAGHSIVTEGFQAQWSYAATDETRTWVFRYRVACAVDVYPDTAALYWSFIGTGWEQPTDHAVVTLHLPGRAEGTFRRPATCDPDADLARGRRRGAARAWGRAGVRSRAAERGGRVRRPADDPVRGERHPAGVDPGGAGPVPARGGAVRAGAAGDRSSARSSRRNGRGRGRRTRSGRVTRSSGDGC